MKIKFIARMPLGLKKGFKKMQTSERKNAWKILYAYELYDDTQK
jgi:hypothetical protein